VTKPYPLSFPPKATTISVTVAGFRVTLALREKAHDTPADAGFFQERRA
jgi:hypothetical protein